MYIDPKPNWELLQTFYGSDYGCYDSNSALPEVEANSLKYRLAAWRYPPSDSSGLIVKTRKLLAIASEWLSGKTISYSFAIPLTLPKEAKIFELGYGSGNWLLAMSQLGYKNLYGYDIDVNSENAHRLRDAGVQVTFNTFLQNDYPENFFDCIRLEHVFEHLIDPQPVLEKCWYMLKTNGVLVMNFPSGNSISLDISIEHSSLRQSPSHLFLHTTSSAYRFLNDAGFKDMNLKQYPVSMQFGSTLNNLLAGHGIKVPPKIFVIVSPIYKLLGSLFGKGDFITVIAIKKCIH